MLVNGMLTNCEVWYNLTTIQIEVLEGIDMMLLRKVLNAHSKTPKEAFYLEAGLIPFRFIIAKRRFMFLWNILKRDDQDMVKNSYKVQKLNPVKGDWTISIEQDKEYYGITHTDEELANMSQGQLKDYINRKVNIKALEYLNSTAISHSKSQRLTKSEVKSEDYLTSNKFSRSEAELLFALRTRMTKTKMNFKMLHGQDIFCTACKLQPETQQHLLQCPILTQNISIPSDLEYEDLYKSTDYQQRIVRLFKEVLRQKEIFEAIHIA